MAPESRSPMAIHDVIHCILAHLDPDPYVNDSHNPEGRSIRQALARLARAHSTFTKPTISALWRSLPGDDVLSHLLCVVGIANEVPQEDGWSGPRLELCGTPNMRESGWKRFEEYTSLVRKIIVDPSRVSKPSSCPSITPPPLLHDTFWCRIAAIFGDAPILPRLTAIHFISADTRRSIDMGALRLLNPSIRELTIKYASVPSGHVERLDTAFAACFPSTPKLEKLSLRWIVHLSTCTRSRSRIPTCATSNLNTTLRFKRLLSLSVYRLGLGPASPLLTPMEAPRLRKLFISTSHIDPRGFRAELFQSLLPFAERFPCLTTFHWSCSFVALSNGHPASRDPGATLAELIEPLLSLRTLRNLLLEVRGPVVPYSSADFGRMAEAWPDLETLSLMLEHMYDREWCASLRLDPRNFPPGAGAGSGAAGGPVQDADYDAFAAFARHCPHLHALRIPRVRIDADADIPTLSSGSPTSHGLQQLLVCELLGLDPEASDERRDGQSRRNGAFLQMMKQIFPYADVHLPGNVTDV
ncbi:hypothetical protein V8D89_005261 [Ganoderma adspersum]